MQTNGIGSIPIKSNPKVSLLWKLNHLIEHIRDVHFWVANSDLNVEQVENLLPKISLTAIEKLVETFRNAADNAVTKNQLKKSGALKTNG